LIFQCDKINFDKGGNPIGRLINWEFAEDIQVAVPRLKVDGANAGIKHSFEVTQDYFASGDRQLVNYKTYYFVAIAYAYNEYMPFFIDEERPIGLYGQKLPYLRGRKTADGQSVVPIAAIPHPPYVHGGGLSVYSDYGTIPNITRIDGQGNGGVALELTQETIDEILANNTAQQLKYKPDAGPLNIKIVDPLRVKPYEYTVFIRDTDAVMDDPTADVSNSSYWVLRIDDSVSDTQLLKDSLIDLEGNPHREIIPLRYQRDAEGKILRTADRKRDSMAVITIGEYEEYIIFPLGLSVTINNKDFVNNQRHVINHWDRILRMCTGNEYKAKLRYCQPNKIEIQKDIIYSTGVPWIEGLRDDNLALPSNWIRAGSYNLGTWATSNTLTNKGGVYKFLNYHQARLEDAFYPSAEILPLDVSEFAERAFKDFSGQFGTLCGGTWAPYVLTSPFDNCPQARYTRPEPDTDYLTIAEPSKNYYWTYEYRWGVYPCEWGKPINYTRPRVQQPAIHPGFNQTMTNLYSVDIVITPDKNLWTRCVVLESCADPTKSEGGALKNEPRKAISRNKNNQPDINATEGFGPSGNQGMSWFPGYAINIETGERLNIMFSENSDRTFAEDPILNKMVMGNDMWFNPTSVYAVATKDFEHIFSNGYTIRYKAGDLVEKDQYDVLFGFYDNFIDDTGSLQGECLSDVGIERVWGGMHYVYVCSSSGNTSAVHYMNGDETEDFFNNARRNFNVRDTVINFNYFQYKRDYPFHDPPYATAQYGGFIDVEKQYPVYDCGPYDESRWLVRKFKQFIDIDEDADNVDYVNPNLGNSDAAQWANQKMPHSYRRNFKMQLFNNVMYTHIPMQPTDVTLQSKWLSSDVTYKIRVTRPYMRYISRWFESPDDRTYKFDESVAHLDNKGFPVYRVSTKEQAPIYHDTRVYQSVLDNINIVPNPYYGGSLYERNAIETKVKIINLPTDLLKGAPVTVNIFTVNGILVRTLTKGDSETSFVDWDLKNFANIPVAGGVYIIHVNCPGIGERMLKFFCTMRPIDLNTF
jgi:hypothetical protein